MATYYTRKNSPYYWINAMDAEGGRRRFSSGVRVGGDGALRKISQRTAEETAREKRMAEDGVGARMKGWVPGWMRQHYRNEKSLARAMNAWAHLSEYLDARGIRHPEEVSYQACHDYMVWRTDAEACAAAGRRCGHWNTALTELRILGTAMQAAVRRGYVGSNPCVNLRIGRVAAKEKRAILPAEQEDIERKLRDGPEWMRDMWLVGMKQGCRISETGTPMALVSEATGTIVFVGKKGKQHNAPLHPDLLPLVERRRREKAVRLCEVPPNAPKLWCQWLERNGYAGVSFHCLRVTVVTRLALANVTAEKAMQYVGHSTELVHAIYRKLRPKDVAELGRFL